MAVVVFNDLHLAFPFTFHHGIKLDLLFAPREQLVDLFDQPALDDLAGPGEDLVILGIVVESFEDLHLHILRLEIQFRMRAQDMPDLGNGRLGRIPGSVPVGVTDSLGIMDEQRMIRP